METVELPPPIFVGDPHFSDMNQPNDQQDIFPKEIIHKTIPIQSKFPDVESLEIDWRLSSQDKLISCAKQKLWAEFLEKFLDLSPVCWLNDSFQTPLHVAIEHEAPMEIIEKMTKSGASKSLRDKLGRTPADVAKLMNRKELLPLLEPVFRHNVSIESLRKIQTHFHALIKDEVGEQLMKNIERYPELDHLLEYESAVESLSVSGMYGGFYYYLAETQADKKPLLCVSSYSRIVMGSGKVHYILETGTELISSGYP